MVESKLFPCRGSSALMQFNIIKSKNKKTKTSELLLIKYIKITKLFVIESYHQVCTKFNISILCYSVNR